MDGKAKTKSRPREYLPTRSMVLEDVHNEMKLGWNRCLNRMIA